MRWYVGGRRYHLRHVDAFDKRGRSIINQTYTTWPTCAVYDSEIEAPRRTRSVLNDALVSISACRPHKKREGQACHIVILFFLSPFSVQEGEKKEEKKKEEGGGLASKLRTSCFGPHVKINQGPGQWTGGSRRSDWRAGFLLLRRSCNSPSPSNPFCIAIAWLFSPSLCCGRALPCCRFLRCCRRGTVHGSQALCREIK